ncbi:hypothetical protein OPT61_g8017 [Boeremia exigua]|uniref:Uncharacterized protein n=1 Tax=Boeremia exigua TaxID=749465 RepID=A0ACC2I112_9PLEO|nr:hypothetical protein OPT61_g8017 [Boeremia exigua]
MSKEKDSVETPRKNAKGDSDVELKQGKKRKRVEVPKKGAGKLTKFDEPNISSAAEGEAKDEKTKLKTGISNPNRKDSKQPPGRKAKPGNARPQQNVPPHLLRKRDELLPKRKALPIWSKAEEIKASLKKNNVLVLTGETGSGKSTQVPQFLLNEKWCTKCIAITQPRRVAAISLARRVAEEMGSYMGSQSPMSKVGYSVRFDNATGPNTKVKFLTEGMLLQEMLRDPVMSQYSAVVVDEVHERSVNVDLILGFLKNLVAGVEQSGKKRDQPLKVVIMSATADVDALVNYFEDSGAPEKALPASGGDVVMKDELVASRVSKCFVEGRQFPVKTVHLPSPTQDWVEAALKLIFQIHYKEPLPGNILVFLTGQDTIEGLEKLVNDYAEGMDNEVPKLLVLPLFAALPQHAQQRIFEPTPYQACDMSSTAANQRQSSSAAVSASRHCSSSPSQSPPQSSAKVVLVVKLPANATDYTPNPATTRWRSAQCPRSCAATSAKQS